MPPTTPMSYAATIALPVRGAIGVTTGAWVYRLGRRCAAVFIAFLEQVLQAFPRAPVIVAICDNDSIHHARKVTAYLSEHPRRELLYGAWSWHRGRSRSLGQVTLVAAWRLVGAVLGLWRCCTPVLYGARPVAATAGNS